MKLFLIFFINFFLIYPISAAFDNSVSTSSGLAHGIKQNKVIKYEDIPYAQPPLNDLRWKAPRKISSPVEISPQTNNFCIQRPSNLGGADGDNFYVGSEDCLYLDIYIPKETKNKKLPVMFWIHGGGNTSGLKDLYDFSKMVSKHDVIVVTANYRLGPFGWFTHPAIQDYQQGDDKTSNFGTLDLIMALRWVNENIENFNGDPENITIFGESAGGHNVLSLLVSQKAKGLFHKAISMSGYTTSISPDEAYNPSEKSSTYDFSTFQVVKNLTNSSKEFEDIKLNDNENIRRFLLEIPAEEFFKIYSDRKPYQELPLLTSDGIVIPASGLRDALSNKDHVNIVPTIAGYNRDEVKLWLASAKYFVDVEFSFLGSVLGLPKVGLNNGDSFEAFNFYRSSAWKIRGVDDPLKSLNNAGNDELYAYRYDWDDHRRFFVANFKQLIGAAHATEIPLLTGSMDLVGGYPLSDLLYPPSYSKRYMSKNLMKFWTNFAKTGAPGMSSNLVSWEPYLSTKQGSYLVLDKKKNLAMKEDNVSFKSLTNKLIDDNRLSKIEKCVVLLQMFTFVGDDLYDENIVNYPEKCVRGDSEQFLKDNASYIEY